MGIQAQEAERTAQMMRTQAHAFQSAVLPSPTTSASSDLDSRASQFKVQAEEAGDTQEGDQARTTLMLRNIPNGYSRDMLLELLNDEGLRGTYDLVYVPWDFNRLAGLG